MNTVIHPIKVVNMYTSVSGWEVSINTTSKSGMWSQLSPFTIGPCFVPGEVEPSKNMENAWQFAKVYKCHTDQSGNPTEAYWDWARSGWKDQKPHRYPMGRGARPEYSLWNGEKLGYVDARKKIYGPLYIDGVKNTEAYKELVKLWQNGCKLVLRD